MHANACMVRSYRYGSCSQLKLSNEHSLNFWKNSNLTTSTRFGVHSLSVIRFRVADKKRVSFEWFARLVLLVSITAYCCGKLDIAEVAGVRARLEMRLDVLLDLLHPRKLLAASQALIVDVHSARLLIKDLHRLPLLLWFRDGVSGFINRGTARQIIWNIVRDLFLIWKGSLSYAVDHIRPS